MKTVLAGVAFVLLLAAANVRAQSLFDISPYLDNAAGAPAGPSVAPSQVDLLFDADSYVPPFYRGRPLASPGSSMHFQAIAHFAGASGAPIPDSQIVFTWRRDGAVVGSVSGLGRSTAVLPAPTLYGTDTISVEAQARSDSAYGSASQTISAVDPGVTLYLDHPLLGVEYYDALGSQSSIPDIEMTFAAVPYFAAAGSPNDSRLSYAWSVNGLPVAATTTSGNEITVNADNSNGLAAIALSLTSPFNPLLDASDSWNFLFSRLPAQAGGGSFAQPNITP